jgi:hypothetical protein
MINKRKGKIERTKATIKKGENWRRGGGVERQETRMMRNL